MPSTPGNRERTGGLRDRPARGVAQDVERELVDDAAGVPDPHLGGDLLPGIDGQGRRDQRDGGSHGRECSRAPERANRPPVHARVARSYPSGGHVRMPVKSTLTGRTSALARVSPTRPSARRSSGRMRGNPSMGSASMVAEPMSDEVADPGGGAGVGPAVPGRDREPAAHGPRGSSSSRTGTCPTTRSRSSSPTRSRPRWSPRCARCGAAACGGSCCSSPGSTTGRCSRPRRPA